MHNIAGEDRYGRPAVFGEWLGTAAKPKRPGPTGFFRRHLSEAFRRNTGDLRRRRWPGDEAPVAVSGWGLQNKVKAEFRN